MLYCKFTAECSSEEIVGLCGCFLTCSVEYTAQHTIQCESKKIPSWFFLTFFENGWEFLVQILHDYYSFLSTLHYKFLLNYLHLWRSYAILCTTTIICSKCPPSVETHAGWLHLIWHNFITVENNSIKYCSLAYIGTYSRHVKFGPKIPTCLEKISENASVHFGRWWTFWIYDMNWVVALNMA